MEDLRKMARWQLLTIVVFAFAKAIRPGVLKSQAPELVKLFLLSFPNFCEAIVGILTLTMLGLHANRRLKWPNNSIYIAAVVLAAIYVITQEFKIHNLGGNNIYDPNDVLFSITGLCLGFVLIYSMKPKINQQ